MANFDLEWPLLNFHEGGFSLDPDDNGNWTSGKKGKGLLAGTNAGVSAPLMCDYLGRQATEADMRALTADMRKKIYKTLFWDKIWGDKINSQKIAHDIFDFAVTSGVPQSIRWHQKLANVPVTATMTIAFLNAINNVNDLTA